MLEKPARRIISESSSNNLTRIQDGQKLFLIRALNRKDMISKEEVDAYRQLVYEAMIKNHGGGSLTDEGRKELKDILETFSDDELKFGMPFNTPEEMAQMLTE